MKSYLKKLFTNALKLVTDYVPAFVIGILVGGIAALYIDGPNAIFLGTLAAILTSGLLVSGWLQAMQRTRQDWIAICNLWFAEQYEAKKERREKEITEQLAEEAERRKQKIVWQSIQAARGADPKAEQGWRLLTFLNGGLSNRVTVRLYTVAGVVAILALVSILFVTALFVEPLTDTSSSWVVVRIMWLGIVSGFALFVIAILHIATAKRQKYINKSLTRHKRRSQTDLYQLLGRIYDVMLYRWPDVEESRSDLQQAATKYLAEVMNEDRYLAPLVQGHCRGEVTLRQIAWQEWKYLFGNLLWLPIALVLFVYRAVFCFMNDNGRIVVIAAGAATLLYLSAAHYLFGGIHWENGWFKVLWLAAAGIGSGVVYFATKERDFPLGHVEPQKVDWWRLRIVSKNS